MNKNTRYITNRLKLRTPGRKPGIVRKYVVNWR